MESKVLYTNDDADVQCVAVKAIETVRAAPDAAGSQQQLRTTLSSASPDAVIFLLPRERLYSYLYIGAADGTLLALRFHVVLQEMAVPGGGSTYEHRVALEAQSKVAIAASPLTAPSSSAAPSPPALDKEALKGVRFIDAPTLLPYVFLRVHGRFQVHEDDTLQMLEPSYTAPLDLAASAVLWMCVGEEQTAASRQRRRGPSPPSAPAAYYALLLDTWEVVLAECTKESSARLAFAGNTAESFGWSGGNLEEDSQTSAATPGSAAGRRLAGPSTSFSVRPYTSTMAWCGDVLLTGSPNYYCLYDTLHGSLLSQLEVGGLLSSAAPYTAYLRSAAMDPSRAGFELAAQSAEVCSCSASSSDYSSGSSREESSLSSRSDASSSSDSEEEGSDGSNSEDAAARRGGHCLRRNAPATAAFGWPSALVFRLRDGELHVCTGAGATDLTCAAPLAASFGTVQAVHGCPPFLLCQRGSGCSGDGDDTEERDENSPGGGSSGVASSRLRASLAGLRRASQQLSARFSSARMPAQVCEMAVFSCIDGHPWASPEIDPVSFMSVNLHDVHAFPLGLLGVSKHMVEALLWKPFAVQLEDQVQAGYYTRVLRFASQCFRGSEAALRGVLRRVCQACATRAMARHRYRVAFYFYTVAEAGVGSLLRLFPELRRPAATRTARSVSRRGQSREHSERGGGSEEGGDGPGDAASVQLHDTSAPRQLSYTSHAPYRALYRILLSHFFSLVAAESATSVTAASPSPLSPASPDAPAAASQHDLSPAHSADELREVAVSSLPAVTAARAPHGASPAPSSPLHWPATTNAAAADTRASVEFALFCLFAVDYAGARRIGSTRDELLSFMIAVQTLHHEECTAAVTALGLPPQALLMTMLLAATGNYDEALTRCQEEADVTAATAALQMYARTNDARAGELSRLYQLHLPWMLEVDPPAMVQLLTTPSAFPGEKPGPAVVLPLLLTVGGTVLLDYLSYLINTGGSADPVVHQLYAMHLVRTLHTLRDEWGLQGFASAELGAADEAGAETGLVGHVRRALLSFLRRSAYYNKEAVLAVLVAADLHEEQCVVLEALDDHVGVLTVLVYTMKDMNRAVRYCEAHYAQDRARVQQWTPLADLLQDRDTADPVASRAAGGGGGGVAGAVAAGSPQHTEETTGYPLQQQQQLHSHSWTAAAGLPADDAAAASRAAAEAVVSCAEAPLFPSRDCRRLLVQEAAAMAHYTHEAAMHGDARASISVAPSRVSAWQPVMRFNPYLHMLLHVLLVPPSNNAMALNEIVWLLSTHSPFMSPRLVLASLPGDLLLVHIAPYLIRAFQRLELNHQLVQMEAAAVQSTLTDAVRRHVSLQQRCVWMAEQRRCVVCGASMERGGLVVVFPNLKPAHFRCHQDATLDPERAVPFCSAAV